MLEIVAKVWNFFAPPQMRPLLDALEIKDVERYKQADNALASLRSQGWKISGTFVIIALAFGWAVSPMGLVKAGDQKKQIEEATAAMKVDIEEVKDRLTTIEKQNTTTNSALNELLAQKVAADICRRLDQLSKEVNPVERRNIRGEIDSLQRRHKDLDGDTYPESRCQ